MNFHFKHCSSERKDWYSCVLIEAISTRGMKGKKKIRKFGSNYQDRETKGRERENVRESQEREYMIKGKNITEKK